MIRNCPLIDGLQWTPPLIPSCFHSVVGPGSSFSSSSILLKFDDWDNGGSGGGICCPPSWCGAGGRGGIDDEDDGVPLFDGGGDNGNCGDDDEPMSFQSHSCRFGDKKLYCLDHEDDDGLPPVVE